MRSLPLLFVLSLTASLSAQQPQVSLVRVTGGLDQPVAITNAGDSRLFITQQTGKIVIWDGTRILPAPFLDLTSIISSGGERGLLSVAFHPRYRDNGRFYVYYTNKSGDIEIDRYTVSATNANVADPNSREPVLTIPHPVNANHNGGQLQFGPDGFLYAGTGDGGGGGDTPNNAQNTNILLGKLLRIDVDGGAPYAIPSGNPFANGTGGKPEIWAYGLRNPWRFSFDRVSGDLWIGDVGQNLWEEIDFQPSTSIGGENYGWRRMEATHCFNPSSNCQTSDMTLPVAEYSHSFGCSVTGGYRYHGTRYRRLQGLYFYSDYCSGTIWTLKQSADDSFSSQTQIDTNFAVSTFGEDNNGELYLADLAGGAIYQVTDALPDNGARRRAVRH
jgi:glucose/arabinose dehydrogenase